MARSNEKLLKGREDLSKEDKRVRGTLVTGLTRQDMRLLDYFEGDVSRLADATHAETLTVLVRVDRNTREIQSKCILLAR